MSAHGCATRSARPWMAYSHRLRSYQWILFGISEIEGRRGVPRGGRRQPPHGCRRQRDKIQN